MLCEIYQLAKWFSTCCTRNTCGAEALGGTRDIYNFIQILFYQQQKYFLKLNWRKLGKKVEFGVAF